MDQIVRDSHKQQFLGRWLGGTNNAPKKEAKIELDLSDLEFEPEEQGWGGITRPGEHRAGEGFPQERGHVDEWDEEMTTSDEDDDEHGGHMMPIPRLF